MKEALDVIRQEHRNLWRIAGALDQAADALAAGNAVDAAFFSTTFDYLEGFVDRVHHPKEDDFLFRRLRQRTAAAAPVLDHLQAEHRQGPAELARLRALLPTASAGRPTSADFGAALKRYAEHLRAHIRCEEKDVLPLASTELLPEDWAEIDRVFLDHEDPLFGKEVRAEFRALFHRLVHLAPDAIGLGAHGAEEKIEATVSAPTLLSVRELRNRYGRIQALQGISFEIRRGELVALVGANGAGKTTCLRALSGVIPAQGTIVFDGEDISRLPPAERVERGICQVPEGRQVFAPLSVEDNLRLGGYRQPKSRITGDLERIYALFPILAEKRRLPAGTLSGGQQQMLAIGRALMGHPRLLLLDEPSMGLAPLLVEEVFNVIETLNAEGMTILLVEQNAHAALAIADRAYVLETGRITLSGPGPALLHNDEIRTAYLGL